jgi:hypothetical protein
MAYTVAVQEEEAGASSSTAARCAAALGKRAGVFSLRLSFYAGRFREHTLAAIE